MVLHRTVQLRSRTANSSDVNKQLAECHTTVRKPHTPDEHLCQRHTASIPSRRKPAQYTCTQTTQSHRIASDNNYTSSRHTRAIRTSVDRCLPTSVTQLYFFRLPTLDGYCMSLVRWLFSSSFACSKCLFGLIIMTADFSE